MRTTIRRPASACSLSPPARRGRKSRGRGDRPACPAALSSPLSSRSNPVWSPALAVDHRSRLPRRLAAQSLWEASGQLVQPSLRSASPRSRARQDRVHHGPGASPHPARPCRLPRFRRGRIRQAISPTSPTTTCRASLRGAVAPVRDRRWPQSTKPDQRLRLDMTTAQGRLAHGTRDRSPSTSWLTPAVASDLALLDAAMRLVPRYPGGEPEANGAPSRRPAREPEGARSGRARRRGGGCSGRARSSRPHLEALAPDRGGRHPRPRGAS
jgi:hypothetical protein